MGTFKKMGKPLHLLPRLTAELNYEICNYLLHIGTTVMPFRLVILYCVIFLPIRVKNDKNLDLQEDFTINWNKSRGRRYVDDH